MHAVISMLAYSRCSINADVFPPSLLILLSDLKIDCNQNIDVLFWDKMWENRKQGFNLVRQTIIAKSFPFS